MSKNHHGDKISKAASTLANPKSSKKEKSRASRILIQHRKNKH